MICFTYPTALITSREHAAGGIEISTGTTSPSQRFATLLKGETG